MYRWNRALLLAMIVTVASPLSAIEKKMVAPFPPVAAADQKNLDELLARWQKNDGEFRTGRIEFTRFEYDQVFGPSNAAKTISSGIISSAGDDKTQIEITSCRAFKESVRDGAPEYIECDSRENWVIDGQTVFQFDFLLKTVVEHRLVESDRKEMPAGIAAWLPMLSCDLPPFFQYAAEAFEPLFVLGRFNESRFKDMYWIRDVTPKDAKNENRLELYPKKQRHASWFKKIDIILDEKALPRAVQIYPANFHARINPSRTVFVFSKREAHNDEKPLVQFKLPEGWRKRIVRTELVGVGLPPEPPSKDQQVNGNRQTRQLKTK